MKSGKEVAYSQDDRLKVEWDVADIDAIAAAGLPVFVARKRSRGQIGPSAGKIADVKPTARQKVWPREKRGAVGPFPDSGFPHRLVTLVKGAEISILTAVSGR